LNYFNKVLFFLCALFSGFSAFLHGQNSLTVIPVGGGWIYDQELEWLWTGKSIYPWMYQPSNKGWVYDYSPTTGSRKFVRE